MRCIFKKASSLCFLIVASCVTCFAGPSKAPAIPLELKMALMASIHCNSSMLQDANPWNFSIYSVVEDYRTKKICEYLAAAKDEKDEQYRCAKIADQAEIYILNYKTNKNAVDMSDKLDEELFPGRWENMVHSARKLIKQNKECEITADSGFISVLINKKEHVFSFSSNLNAND